MKHFFQKAALERGSLLNFEKEYLFMGAKGNIGNTWKEASGFFYVL